MGDAFGFAPGCNAFRMTNRLLLLRVVGAYRNEPDIQDAKAAEKNGGGARPLRPACFAATLLVEWALDHPIPEIP